VAIYTIQIIMLAVLMWSGHGEMADTSQEQQRFILTSTNMLRQQSQLRPWMTSRDSSIVEWGMHVRFHHVAVHTLLVICVVLMIFSKTLMWALRRNAQNIQVVLVNLVSAAPTHQDTTVIAVTLYLKRR
jgi:hypothetical protein